MSASAALEVSGLRLSLPRTRGAGGFVALHDIDLSVRGGEILALLGSSAAGKSLLGLALLGLGPPGGSIEAERFELAGSPLDPSDQRSWQGVRGARIGWIPQSPADALDPFRCVEAQLKEALEVHGRSSGRETLFAALEEAGLDDPQAILRAFPHQLSGGMAQRVVLAMTLALQPEVVVADEPTTALDLCAKAAVLEALSSRAAAGAAVILITHDLDAVRAFAHRCVVLVGGRLVAEGPVPEALDAPKHPALTAIVEGRLAIADDLEASS